MSKLDTKPYKGVRDFYPEDQFIQNHIFKTWKRVAERFGYEEYSASILEPTEIYSEKSGEEIVNEQTFSFVDRGGRDVTLRPEMTPTVARMVAAKRRELGFPLRWYSIPNLFRYEAPQRGRLREHWQLNLDIFGIKDIAGDIELIQIAVEIMREFGAKDSDFEIKLNNYGEAEKLEYVVQALPTLGIENFKIDKTLMRGQSYYTGVVFEFFDTNKENPRSILGGGRYDNLTGLFEDSDLPSIGFGAGDVTIRDFLETHSLLPKYKPSTNVSIAIVEKKHFPDAEELAKKLRESEVNVSVDWTERKLGDQIKHASKLGIKWLIVLGEEEAKSKKYKLKNLETGEEKEVKENEVAECVK